MYLNQHIYIRNSGENYSSLYFCFTTRWIQWNPETAPVFLKRSATTTGGKPFSPHFYSNRGLSRTWTQTSQRKRCFVTFLIPWGKMEVFWIKIGQSSDFESQVPLLKKKNDKTHASKFSGLVRFLQAMIFKAMERSSQPGTGWSKKEEKGDRKYLGARITIKWKLHFALTHDVLWRHFPLLSICSLLCRFMFLPCPSICSADGPQETNFPGCSPKDGNGTTPPSQGANRG